MQIMASLGVLLLCKAGLVLGQQLRPLYKQMCSRFASSSYGFTWVAVYRCLLAGNAL